MATIRNFGHHWSRDLINWETGTLLGALGRNAYYADADFHNQVGVYILFNQSHEAIYASQTGRQKVRLLNLLRQHAHGPIRNEWTSFSWFGILDVDHHGCIIDQEGADAVIRQHSDEDAMHQLEAILMRVLAPRLAKHSQNWNDTVEYFQIADEASASLERLRDEVQKLRAMVVGKD